MQKATTTNGNNAPRRDRHDVVAALGELDRQAADDVAEAAGLGPRRDLGGDEDEVERVGCCICWVSVFGVCGGRMEG